MLNLPYFDDVCVRVVIHVLIGVALITIRSGKLQYEEQQPVERLLTGVDPDPYAIVFIQQDSRFDGEGTRLLPMTRNKLQYSSASFENRVVDSGRCSSKVS